MKNRPFKFLDPYTKEDVDIFFGREQEIEEIYRHLFQQELFLLYGQSGSGKTSLLQCGLARKFSHQISELNLQQDDYLPLFIRRGSNLKESLEFCLDEASKTPLKESQTIQEKVFSLHLDYQKPIFLIFDQFEELFIFGDQDEKDWFRDTLASLLQPNQLLEGLDLPGIRLNISKDLHIILSIREEYLFALTEFEQDIPSIFQNRFRVELMSGGQAEKVITEPCRVCGVDIEQGLVKRLVKVLTGPSGRIDLTFLQVLMDQLYNTARNRDQEAIRIGSNDFEESGDLNSLLSHFLDQQLEAMDDQEAGELILKALVSPQGTKRPSTLSDIHNSLRTIKKELSEEKILSLIHHFISSRIINDKDEQGFYELRHDILANRIFARMTRKEKDIAEIIQLLEGRLREYHSRRKLLDKDTLEFLAPYEKSIYLRPGLRNLIVKSRNYQLRVQRRMRRVTIGIVGFMFLFFAGFSIWALMERTNARVNERRSKSLYLAAEAIRQIPLDNTKALRIAEAAYKLDPYEKPPEVIRALNTVSQSLFEQPLYRKVDLSLNDGIDLTSSPYDYSKNLEKVIVGASDGSVRVWTLDGHLESYIKVYDAPISGIQLSPNGEFFLVRYGYDYWQVWTINGKLMIDISEQARSLKSMMFSPSSQYIAAVDNGRLIRTWDIKNGEIADFDDWKRLDEFMFSPKGEKLVLRGENSIGIWDYKHDLYKEFSGVSFRGSVLRLSLSQQEILIVSGKTERTLVYNWGGELIDSTRCPKISYLGYTPAKSDVYGSRPRLIGDYRNIETTIYPAKYGKTRLSLWPDSSVVYIDRNTNSIVNLKDRFGPILKAGFSPDDQLILILNSKKSLYLFNPKLQTHINCGYQPEFSDFLDYIGFTDDGERIVLASRHGLIRIIDIHGNLLYEYLESTGIRQKRGYKVYNGSLVLYLGDHLKIINLTQLFHQRLLTNQNSIECIEVSEHSNRIAVANSDGKFRLWDIESDTVINLPFDSNGDQALFAEFSMTNKLITIAADEAKAALWSQNGRLIREYFEPDWTQIDPFGSLFSPDGKLISIAEGYGPVNLFNDRGDLIKRFEQPKYTWGPIFSPDSKLMLTCQLEGLTQLWDQKGEIINLFNGGGELLQYFTPDSKRILTVSKLGIQLWDEIHFNYDQKQIVFSQDSQHIIVGLGDSIIRVWDTNGNQLCIINNQSRRPMFKVSPTEDLLASLNKNGDVSLFNFAGEEQAVLTGHSSQIKSLCYSDDGKYLISFCSRICNLWNSSGSLITRIVLPSATITDVSFGSSSGPFIIRDLSNRVRICSFDGHLLGEFNSSPMTLNGFSTRFTHQKDAIIYQDGTSIKVFNLHKDILSKLWEHDNLIQKLSPSELNDLDIFPEYNHKLRSRQITELLEFMEWFAERGEKHRSKKILKRILLKMPNLNQLTKAVMICENHQIRYELEKILEKVDSEHLESFTTFMVNNLENYDPN